MMIGRVMGNVWATKKDPLLNGQRFLIIKPIRNQTGRELTEDGELMVAVDPIGAGFGDLVLVTFGGGSREGGKHIPIDAAIVGIIDSVDLQTESGAKANET